MLPWKVVSMTVTDAPILVASMMAVSGVAELPTKLLLVTVTFADLMSIPAVQGRDEALLPKERRHANAYLHSLLS